MRHPSAPRGTDLILAIDQGTTSTRAILFEASGAVRHIARRDLRQIYPQPGWVEHDPEEIWQAVVATCREAIAAARIVRSRRSASPISARPPCCGSVPAASRCTTPSFGKIAAPRRSASNGATRASRPRSRSAPAWCIDPYFSASKLRWLLDNVPGLRERAAAGKIAFGTIDSFLLWRLTGGRHQTDVTNASRTMLYEFASLAWDEELLRDCSASRHRCCPRCSIPAPSTAAPSPRCSATQSPSRGSPATSRRR